MMQIVLVGSIAGLASAAMFSSIASGLFVSLLLLYLAPLPLMTAALGWGHVSALIGTAIAGGGMALAVSDAYAFAFVLMVGAPACWLGYLALLARQGADGTIDWYPVNRLVLWTAATAALIVAGSMLTMGSDADAIRGVLYEGLLRTLDGVNVSDPTSSQAASITQMAELLSRIAPAAAAVVAAVTLFLNFWLAGRIVRLSGGLRRPWPSLASITMPPLAVAALATAFVAAFSSGLLGLFGQIALSTLIIAFTISGFAFLHSATLGLKSRGLWLATAWVLVLLFGWPIVAAAIVGIADSLFDLRTRLSGKLPPPSLT